jgi:sorbitol/mannitol transport system permease protein
MSASTLASAPSGRTPERSVVRPRRPKGRTTGHLLTVIAWAAGLLFFAPVAWMVLTSFKQESQAASSPPTFFFTPTLEQYASIVGSSARARTC